jgi:Ca2+-binding RTX toxin-like protein
MKFTIYLVTIDMTILLTFNMGTNDGTVATLLFAQLTDRGKERSSNYQSSNLTGNLWVRSFGDDRIIGTSDDDVIIGLTGSDTINGGERNDKIQGNEDSDKLYGDEGNDVLQGGLGSEIYGREGDDVLVGGIDDDYLIGNEGNDKLYGSERDDILVGGHGADYFDCGEGTDVVIDFNISENDDNAGDCEEIIGSETIMIR